MMLVATVLLAAATWVAFPGDVTRRCRVRTKARRPLARRRPNRLAPTIELICAALDAGLAPPAAVSLVAAALPSSLGRAASLVDLSGQPAWDMLVDDPDLGALAATFSRSESSGAPVAEGIRVLAEEVRRTERAERLERARRVGVRTAAPLGLCFLPAFFAVAVVPTVVGLIGSVL